MAILVLSSFVLGVGAVGVPVKVLLLDVAGIGYTWFNFILVVILNHPL